MNVRKLLTSLVCAGIATLTATSASNVTPITENVTTETETVTNATTDNLYPSCGIVTSVTSTELEWTDFNGNIWVIVGDPEDWCEGDRIAVIMDNNGTTETIYDDIVVKTKYCGWEY
jgi:hypothetical protein